jgi:hypothetical protein
MNIDELGSEVTTLCGELKSDTSVQRLIELLSDNNCLKLLTHTPEISQVLESILPKLEQSWKR